jgi:uncharacterized membrane protein
VRWISLAVLAAAGIVLAIFWGDVPDRWITHWGVHGPDGWATKSVANAALPLLLGLAQWTLFELLARSTTHRKTALPREMMQVLATVFRALGFGLVLVCAGLAVVLPLVRPRSALPIAVGTPLLLVLVVGGAAVWAWRRTRQLRASGVALPEGYSGIFYKNPHDARLWVPKAAGIGWTINLAHRGAWAVMLALVGVPIAVAILVASLAP